MIDKAGIQDSGLFSRPLQEYLFPHNFPQARLSVLIRRSARNFGVTRHPTETTDSTLPSLWSNADFRRANIALSDGGSITPCLAEVLRLSKL
jgi:hypothetical protein